MSTSAISLALDSSPSAAVFGCVVFGALSGGHIYLCFRDKTWFFQFLYWGALLELASFLALASASNTSASSHDGKAILIVVLFLQLIGPSLVAISTYMTLDRLVWFLVPADQHTGRNLWISQWQIAVTAVVMEILCFIFTFTGGVIFVLDLTGYDQPAVVTGYRLMTFGLSLQLAVRIYLVASSLKVAHTSRTGVANNKAGNWDTGTVFNVLTIAGLSLTFRALYSVIVVASKAKQHTWMLYVFDALPIAVVMCAFAIVHPGQVLPLSFTRFRLKVKNDAMMEEARRVRGTEVRDQALHGEAKVVPDEQTDEVGDREKEAKIFAQHKTDDSNATVPPAATDEEHCTDSKVKRTPQEHGTWV